MICLFCFYLLWKERHSWQKIDKVFNICLESIIYFMKYFVKFFVFNFHILTKSVWSPFKKNWWWNQFSRPLPKMKLQSFQMSLFCKIIRYYHLTTIFVIFCVEISCNTDVGLITNHLRCLKIYSFGFFGQSPKGYHKHLFQSTFCWGRLLHFH